MNYTNKEDRTISNSYQPTVYGVGYMGVGKYKSQIDGVRSKIYNAWNKILERAYSKKLHLRKPTYKDVTVCKEWHNFQVFGVWYEENWKPHMIGWHLDKDILVKGNKVYSPNNCCFVSREINNLLTNRLTKRGQYPIGVRKSGNNYQANLSINGVFRHLGTFDTPEEAFQAYKIAKENYIKEVADKWRPLIEIKLYKAMINYKVEITD